MPKAFSPQDKYFHLAKERGFRARSAFKLEEILDHFPKILPRKAKVIDFGAAPGSFLQVLGERNAGGKICGVDLQAIEKFPKGFPAEILTIQGDIFAPETAAQICEFFRNQKADVIVSDVAPKTSGVPSVDQWKSIELNIRILELCNLFLKPKGTLITKIFRGEDFEEFWVENFRNSFGKPATFRPHSCRDRSVEFFLVGQDFLGFDETSAIG